MAGQKDPAVSRRQVLRGLGLGVAAGTLSPLYARHQAYDLRVVEKTLELPKWNADGFRVAFLSDFHVTGASQTDRAMESVRLALAAKPDVLLVGGDFLEHNIESEHENVRRFLKAFDGAPCPCVTVLGNHDYWSTSVDVLTGEIHRSNLKLLRNELFELDGVTIAGIDDYIDLKSRFDFYPRGRVSKNLIAILHEPDVVKRQPDHVSLQVSGHSHGGQVCLPFGKHVHTPGFAKKYIAGFYPAAKVPLYVTKGVGTTGVDYRLFCDPEVSVLTLRQE